MILLNLNPLVQLSEALTIDLNDPAKLTTNLGDLTELTTNLDNPAELTSDCHYQPG